MRDHPRPTDSPIAGSCGLATTSLVFGICGVVFGALTACDHPHANKREGKARMDSLALDMAIASFVADYERMPYPGTSDTVIVTSTNTDLLRTLMGMDDELNKRSIRYLAFLESAEKRNGIVYEKDGRSVKGWYDPWGGGYHVCLDLDGDEKLEIDGKVLSGRRSAVWSAGPDRKSGTEDDVRTW